MEAITISSFDFLRVLVKNKNFSDFIINNNKDIQADVITYRQDVNCSCKSKLTKYFDNNKELIRKQINEFCETNKTSEKELFALPSIGGAEDRKHRNVLKSTLPASEWHKYKDVIGDVVEISPDPNEYKRIISIAREEWLYNGLNVLETVKLDPQTGKEAVVWLLFFH